VITSVKPFTVHVWPTGLSFVSAGFFVLGFSDEPVEQEYGDDAHEKKAERSENRCIVE
jgi:hypothetical protein